MGTLTQYYNVILLCNNNQHFKNQETIQDVLIHRMSSFSLLPQKVAKLLRFPLFFNPLWLYKSIKLIIQQKIDIIHAHDLPMVPLGLILGKLFNLPVIYDMHENYPAALKEWGKKGILNFVFKNYKLALILNDWCTQHVDKIIVVVDEMKELLVNKGVSIDKIHIVSNTVNPKLLLDQKLNSNIINRYNNRFIITYLGKFSPERGLQTAIDAMPIIKKEIPNCLLLLAGDGSNRVELQEYAKELNLYDSVDFPGWIEYKDYLSYITISDICIIPQPSNSSNDTTIPHKLFEYLAAGKPVLASDAKPLWRILNEYSCGKTFLSNSPDSFADAALEMYANQKKYIENGKRAIDEKYNWSETAKELLKLYRDIEAYKSK